MKLAWRILWLSMVSMASAWGAEGGQSDDAARLAAGMKIYRQGILSSGEPLHAESIGQVGISGAAAACINCHRRSGMGSAEGGQRVLPVTGSALFRNGLSVQAEFQGLPPPPTEMARPPYNDETLALAIREGVSPSGRTLLPLMPRFQISDEELKNLFAYLKSLSHDPSQGVQNNTIHWATVIQPDATPAQRQALLDVAEAYVKDHNTDPKSKHRSRQPLLPEKYFAPLHWEMHPWVLQGAPDTWARQLQEFQRQRPVFAVLGGLGDGDWQPIHDFCEQREVPCLFPITQLPVIHKGDFYSVYFSRGMQLEGDVLAKHLRSQDDNKVGRILQVYRPEPAGERAAAALRSAFVPRPGVQLQERRLAPGEKLDGDFWRKLLDSEKPDTLVLWLKEADLAGWKTEAGAPTQIYVSESMLDGRTPDALGLQDERLRMISYWANPKERSTHFTWMRNWLTQNGVKVTDEIVQGDTFWILWMMAVVTDHIGGNYSSELLVEEIEHMMDRLSNSSLFPRTTLGPDQRFAAKGCYVQAKTGGVWKALPPGLVIP